MKKYLLGAIALLVLSVSGSAQSNRATRPRVVPTPTPKQPVLRGDTPSERRPPILSGSPNSRTDPAPAADETPGEDEVIKVETNLVTMPVSVLDRNGRFVAGLRASDFQIFENGVQQKIDYFQSVEQPFTVILLIDVSPSTQYRIDEIQQAAITFVDQLRPADRVMVIAFDENVRILSRPTNDRRTLRNAIRQAQFGDGTSLYEAVDHVINRDLRTIEGRKAVVLFTDGVDTTSRRANYQNTIADVEEADALFYTIRYNTQRDVYGGNGGGGVWTGSRRRGGLGDILTVILGGGMPFPGSGGGGGSRGSSSSEYETGRRYLDTLSRTSGGRMFEADTLRNINSAFAGIAEELRQQYSLGYYPESVGKAGDRRQIRVRVMRPNVVVKAKQTYIVGQNNDRFAGK